MRDKIYCQRCRRMVEYTHVCTYHMALTKVATHTKDEKCWWCGQCNEYHWGDCPKASFPYQSTRRCSVGIASSHLSNHRRLRISAKFVPENWTCPRCRREFRTAVEYMQHYNICKRG